MKIEKAAQISTKTGDKGVSSTFAGERLPKYDLIFETLGGIDELSSFIGLLHHYHPTDDLREIQKILERIAALVATVPDHPNYARIGAVGDTDLTWLETRMDSLLKETPIEAGFVLPGSDTSLSGAYADVARAVARRSERNLARLIAEKKRPDLDPAYRFSNRVSDYLYVLTRSLKSK